MIHKILSTFGLGILGIDPITAVYLLSMGLRNEKKTKVTLFFFVFCRVQHFCRCRACYDFRCSCNRFYKECNAK